MNRENINRLINNGSFPLETDSVDLIETHISWVIICDDFVYKIKKPIKYSFLDFSTLEKRKFYCEREIELNNRLTKNIYLGVLPVKKMASKFFIGNDKGEVVDYAVNMQKLPADKRMDKLLSTNKISGADIKNLAVKICSFHRQTNIIYKKNVLEIQQLFNDILAQKDFLQKNLNCGGIITEAVHSSDKFLKQHNVLLEKRITDGFVRDCHGDLHSRNIFLLPEPVPFDCIEFNDDLRQIDVLNEIAFLCMDMEALGRQDLADLFFCEYNKLFLIARNEEERKLFFYCKAYRANIRAKINSMRTKDATKKHEKKEALYIANKYLLLMQDYMAAAM